MQPFYWLFNTVIELYIFVLIAAAILSWLVMFNVVNRSNAVVSAIGDITYRLTEPALRPIRRYVPTVGGLDLSFIVLFIGVKFLQVAVNTWIFQPLL